MDESNKFAANNQKPLIELRGVSKSFGNKKVLKNINLKVNKGDSLAIIGGSGHGKSVLAKCMIGLMPISAGEILFDGKRMDSADASSLEAVMKRIGVLFQGAALFDSLNIWENVAFRLINAQGMSRHNARSIAISKLLLVGLPESVANLYPNELSGGMQKRVGLARAVCGGADILFFDEPTTGLDPVVSGQINRLLHRVIMETGSTAVTITHSIETVRQVADKVIFIHEGQIEWKGSSRELGHSGNALADNFVMGRLVSGDDKPEVASKQLASTS